MALAAAPVATLAATPPNAEDNIGARSGRNQKKLFTTGLACSYSMFLLESVSLKEDVGVISDVIFESAMITVEFCITSVVTFDWVEDGNDVGVVFRVSFNSEVVIEEACVKSVIYLELIF